MSSYETTMTHRDPGATLAALERLLSARPSPESWPEVAACLEALDPKVCRDRALPRALPVLESKRWARIRREAPRHWLDRLVTEDDFPAIRAATILTTRDTPQELRASLLGRTDLGHLRALDFDAEAWEEPELLCALLDPEFGPFPAVTDLDVACFSGTRDLDDALLDALLAPRPQPWRRIGFHGMRISPPQFARLCRAPTLASLAELGVAWTGFLGGEVLEHELPQATFRHSLEHLLLAESGFDDGAARALMAVDWPILGDLILFAEPLSEAMTRELEAWADARAATAAPPTPWTLGPSRIDALRHEMRAVAQADPSAAHTLGTLERHLERIHGEFLEAELGDEFDALAERAHQERAEHGLGYTQGVRCLYVADWTHPTARFMVRGHIEITRPEEVTLLAHHGRFEGLSILELDLPDARMLVGHAVWSRCANLRSISLNLVPAVAPDHGDQLAALQHWLWPPALEALDISRLRLGRVAWTSESLELLAWSIRGPSTHPLRLGLPEQLNDDDSLYEWANCRARERGLSVRFRAVA